MIRILLNETPYPENFFSWQERKETISRSEKYWGVVTTVNVDLQLIGLAANYIISLDSANDVAAECSVKIQDYDNFNGWTTSWEGVLDFTTLKIDTRDIKKVTISAVDSDFINRFLERDEIEIPYDKLETLDGETIEPFDNEYQEIEILGVDVVTVIQVITTNYLPQESEKTHFTFPFHFNQTIDNFVISTLMSATGLYSPDWEAPDQDFINDRIFFKGDGSTGRLKGTFVIKVRSWDGAVSNFSSWSLLDYKDNSLTPVKIYEELGVNVGSGDYTYTFDIDYEFSATSRILLKMFSDGVDEIYEEESEFIFTVIKDPTTCNFVPPFEAITRTLESITGTANALDSEYFGRTDNGYEEDGEGSMLFLTNGKLLRQFPLNYLGDKASQLTFSFKDLFENFDKIKCLGLGIRDGKIYIDKRKNFFLPSVSVEFTKDMMELDSFEIGKYMDLYYNEITVGSEYEQPEEVSSLEEYNSKMYFSTPILNSNKLELVTKYIYAAYPFEFARRKTYVGSETEDYKYDEKNFILKVIRDGETFVQHSDEDFEEITGLDDLTKYINLDISPKRNLLNFGWWLNSGFRAYQANKITYNKSEVVTDLSTRKISESKTLTECADINITSLENAILTGRVVRYSAAISSLLFNTLKENPYGVILYPDLISGETGYGYLKEISRSIIDKKTNVELWEAKIVIENESLRLLEDGYVRLLEDGGYRLLE